jgi:2-oxoglutarate ferredoxin oxidoreductase subunit delta
VAQIVIDRNRCKGCELCVNVCPQKVLAISRDTNARGQNVAFLAEPKRCIGCRLCCITCPDVAIDMRVSGTYYRYFLG